MKRIVVSLLVASVAFLNTFGQGIENKLWVAKVEQGDNIILANEGIAMFYLNSLSKEYMIAPLDDSIEYSSGTYSINQSGSKYTLRLLTGFVPSGAEYEITLQTDRKGTFLFTTPLAGLFQRGSLELWADCSGGLGIPNEKRTDYIVTIPENFNTHSGTASKISWNGDKGCFQTLTIDDLNSGGTHFDKGTISSITGEKTQTVLFSGEQENFSVNLEYLCDTIGNFDAFFPRNPIHSHSGVFIIVPDLEIISDFEDLDQYFSPLPCDELKITTHPHSQTVKNGATLLLNVAVTSETDYTVNWYRDGIPLGRTGNTLQITNFRQTNDGDYWAIAENFAGEVRSNTATVTWEAVGNPPEFTVQPTSQQIQEGQSFSLTVEVSSAEAYETIWYKDGILSVYTGTTLNIPSASKNDEGEYWAVASNPYGQARSAIAKIWVTSAEQLPLFTTHPISQSVTEGETFFLEVKVASPSDYALQWFKDGKLLASTSPNLVVANAGQDDAGSYWAVATNYLGGIASNKANIQIETIDFPDATQEFPAITHHTPVTGHTSFFRVSNNGIAAGETATSKSSRSPLIFSRTEGATEIVGTFFQDKQGRAISISDDGETVVGYWTNGASWFYEDGVQMIIQFPARGISGDGNVIVGGTKKWNKNESFATDLLPLGLISASTEATAASFDGSTVVGQSVKFQSNLGEGLRAVAWMRGSNRATDLGTLGKMSQASDVSSDGEIVIGRSDGPNGSEAFIWRAATGMVGLGDLDGGVFFSESTSISGDGNIVTGRSYTEYGSTGFVWTASDGMRDIVDIIGPSGYGWRFEWGVRDVSSNGKYICGSAINPAGGISSWIAFDETGQWNKSSSSRPLSVRFFSGKELELEYFQDWGAAHIYSDTANVEGEKILEYFSPERGHWMQLHSDDSYLSPRGYRFIHRPEAQDVGGSHLFRLR